MVLETMIVAGNRNRKDMVNSIHDDRRTNLLLKLFIKICKGHLCVQVVAFAILFESRFSFVDSLTEFSFQRTIRINVFFIYRHLFRNHKINLSHTYVYDNLFPMNVTNKQIQLTEV